jgi:hypothetical protein
MQNPAMQQMMQQMMSQPQMMESLTQNAVNNNPQLRQMLDSDPRLRWAYPPLITRAEHILHKSSRIYTSV